MRRIERTGRGRARSGFSMVELLVAIGVLMVATLAAFSTQLKSFQLIDSSRDSTVAMTDLEVCMEEVLTRTVDAIPGEFPEGAPIDGFTGLHLPQQRIVPAYPNYAGFGPSPDVLEVVLTSSWVDGRGRPQAMTLSTAKAR
ncbi:MAG: prepilin-type N-terminal cleavage/methylation domain-containing protein [Planctomycetota bacterium]